LPNSNKALEVREDQALLDVLRDASFDGSPSSPAANGSVLDPSTPKKQTDPSTPQQQINLWTPKQADPPTPPKQHPFASKYNINHINGYVIQLESPYDMISTAIFNYRLCPDTQVVQVTSLDIDFG
jgi:hypothetical protein